ncbi:MAG: hypothetical protein OEY49_13390, partial [Candidatus Heimdallarchaeota archaeon]|nr:hypothetical protein [Candidatus Heimdallarchaeota archaeon]
TSSYYLEFDLYKLSTYSGGNYTIHIDPFINLINYPFLELHIPFLIGQWRIGLLYNNTYYFSDLVRGYNRLNIHKLVNYDYSTNKTIDAIVLIAPNRISSLYFRELSIYTIDGLNFQFGPDANKYSSTWIEEGSIYTNANTGSTFDTKVTFTLNQTLWDLTQYQFFDFRTSSPVKIECVTNLGNTFIIDQLSAKGNFVGLTADPNLSHLSFVLNSTTAIDTFGLYNIPGVSLSLLGHDLFTPVIQSSDYLYSNNGGLEIHSSSSSLLFIDFDYFEVGQSRFVEVSVNDINLYDGAFYLSFNVGATTNSFGIDTSRLLTHRSINEQNPSGQQSMWLRVDGEVSTIVNSIKFYTISGWTFRDINDISNILDPNSVAYIGNLDTSRDIYNRFLRGEFSLIDLPIYMNNQNPNYPLYELALPDKTNYRHFDFSSSTEGFTGRNIQSTPSSIIVPQYNFNITLMYNGITALHGNFLIIRAKSQGINTRAYLDHISDGSNIFWQANDETYSLNTNYTIYSINLLNSPSQVNHSWLNSTNLYITFKTSLIETSSNGIEFDFITLTNDPTPALTYQGLEVYEQFSSVDSTKSFTEYTRFTSTGLTSTISVFMSTNVENSLMNDTDHIELIVRGSSSTPLLDFGYRVLGVNNTVEFISLGSLAQSFSLYRLYGMTEIPEFVLMNSYGDPIPENVYIEIGSVKLLSKGLNYNQNDIISNWNVISQFSDPQPVDNEFVRYIANGLSPLASITTRFSPSLLRKYNIMKFKFRASNSSIGDLLAIYDYVGSQLASAIPIFEITSNHLGTTTVIIDLSQHSFISTPHITLVSNSSIYGASIPLDSTDYIDIKDIEFISSNAFTPLQNVEEIDRDSSDIILDPFDTTSTVSTSNLIVDDPRLYNRLYVDFTPTSTSYLEISISVYDEYGIETILQLDPVISNPYAKVYENIRTGLLIPLNDPAWDDSKHFIFSISSNSTFGTTKFNFHSFVLINTLDISDGIGITSLDGIQWVNSLTDPFVTVDNNNLLSRTGTSTLHLRSDGTNGTISAPTESIPFDIYYISFDYFTINMQHGEKLRLLVNSSSLIQIEEIDLLTGLNRWTHYTKMINMSSSMNLYGAIGTSLIIQIIDNSTIISETNVLIDNIILKRLNPMFSITSTHFELGFENNPVIDLVMTPRQSGLEIFMDEGDGTNLISVKFDPTDMQVKILTNGTYYTTILYNFYFGLRYRISIITEPTKVLVNVWEATTERSEKSILREVTIVPQNGMKHFYANATNSNPHHSSLNHIFLQNSGFESGVDAQGYFDLTQGRVRHYSMDDDYLKLVDSMGNHLRTRDYSIRFDYLLEIGELRFNASGIYVIIQQYQIIINGITISIDQIEGSVYIEKYGSNVIVWLNDVSILHTKTYQDRDDIVTFFGNGIYEISNIFLNYERSSLRDSGKLVLEGPAFIMRFDSVIDLSRATYASFEVEMGSIEFITDRDTGMNWIIYDNLVLKATEILNMSGGSTRTFKFIHNGVNNPNVKSIFNGFSVLTGTNPVGFSSTLVNDTRFDNISSFNPRSFYLNNDLYFGLEGLDRDYSTSYFPHGFSEGVYQLQFYLDPNVDPSSDVNYAGVKFIVSTNQGIEEFIEIRISERTYEGSVYYFDGSDPNANDIREYNYYLDRASYSVTFGSSTGVTSNYNYNHVYQSWVRPAFRTVGGALEASQAIQDYVWSTVGLDSYVNNIDGWNVPTGSLRGLHQLDVYKLENSYFAFLDGKYITQFNGGSISDWGRSFYNSESIGFGVTKNAVAIRMDVREGSTLPVEGLEISGNYISIDNSLHLLPDGLSNTYVTTVNSFNLTDISHASISLSVNGDDTSISILPDLVGEFEIGVTVSTTSVGTYSNPSAYTSIIEGFAYNTSKIINLDFLFNPTPYNDISNYVLNHNIPFLSPPINTRLLLYGDTVSRDLGNSIDFAELINVKDRYRPRIATAGTGITIIQKLNFGTLEYTYEETSDTNYNPVVEGSGYFPTYALIGQVSHAANFTKYKNQLQREFILNGFTNGTIPISFNYYSKYSLRQYSKFNVTFSNLDNSVNFQLIFTRNYVWLKINGGMYFIGSYTPGRSIEAKLRIDTKSNTLFAGFSGKGFEYEINKTINNPVLTGT